MPLVVFVATLVKIATFPCEHSHAVLFVVLVSTFVHVAVLVVETFLPLALTVLESVFELTDVATQIFPFVLALAIRLAIQVSASVAITIRKDVRTLPGLQTVLPFALESISVLPLVNTVPCSL
jgi:hypothetical protein